MFKGEKKEGTQTECWGVSIILGQKNHWSRSLLFGYSSSSVLLKRKR